MNLGFAPIHRKLAPPGCPPLFRSFIVFYPTCCCFHGLVISGVVLSDDSCLA